MDRVTPPPSPLADGPPVRAELLFLAIMGALALLLVVAGVPGGAEPVAGGGSDALRQGWAAARPVDSGASEPAPETLPEAAHLDGQGLPTGRGRTPSDERGN